MDEPGASLEADPLTLCLMEAKDNSDRTELDPEVLSLLGGREERNSKEN